MNKCLKNSDISLFSGHSSLSFLRSVLLCSRIDFCIWLCSGACMYILTLVCYTYIYALQCGDVFHLLIISSVIRELKSFSRIYNHVSRHTDIHILPSSGWVVLPEGD